MSSCRLIQGDAISIPLKDNSVQSAIMSPPYWALRKYGSDDQEIGLELLDDYVSDLQIVFSEIKVCLKDNGLLWLNLGDTWAGSGGAGGDYNKGGGYFGQQKYRQIPPSDIPFRSLCLVPFRVASALIETGWILRQTIIWDKGQTKPEDLNHIKRPGIQHEYIFMFAKSKKYKYYPEWHVGSDAERGSVWHVRPCKGKKNSPAPMPDEIVRRCVELSTDEGDIVFDPFCGSGTTPKVADSMGRIGIGMDLYGDKWL